MAVALPTVPFLRGKVGATGAVNNEDDVLWVQALLSLWLRSEKKPAVAVDGGFGQKSREALVAFQREVVGLEKPDGIVEPGGKTARHLQAQRTNASAKVTTGPNFLLRFEEWTLDATLLQRMVRLGQFLIESGFVTGNVSLDQGVRKPSVAHQWSTSYNIRKGKISLAELQSLKQGKDLDGNLWYNAEWEKGLAKDAKGAFTAKALQELWKKINANARHYFESNAIAAEGYKQTDPRIKPNAHPAISNHVSGRAIDADVPWKSGALVYGGKITDGENSDVRANRIVAAFRLSRPVASERWHYQLLADKGKGFVAKNNLIPGKHPLPKQK